MLLVVCPDPETLASADANLRSRTSREFVAIDNGGLALRVLKFNPVEHVLIDVRGCTRAWLHTFGKELSATARCLAIGVNPREIPELQSFLPTTRFVPTPVDWDEVVSLLEGDQSVEPAKDVSGIVAVGLEDLLGLLAMTGTGARIQVSSGSRHGQLVLKGGIVVHAQRGPKIGMDAAYEILAWPEPQVKSKPVDDDDFETTMAVPVSGLLCEAARRRDEIVRLASMVRVQRIIDRIAGLPGFVAAVVSHVDTGESIVSRGTEDAQMVAEALHHIAETANFWGPPGRREAVGHGSRGAVFWHEKRVTISVPVTRQLVMTVISRNVTSFAPLRNSVVAAAKSLAELTGPHIAVGGTGVAAAFSG